MSLVLHWVKADNLLAIEDVDGKSIEAIILTEVVGYVEIFLDLYDYVIIKPNLLV